MPYSKDQIDYIKQATVGLEECHTNVDAFRNGLQEEFDAMSARKQTGEEGETFTDLIDRLDNLFVDIESVLETAYAITERKKVRK